MEPTPPVVIAAALERTSRVIGRNNSLLWHLPQDLKRFKALTLGHPIIMGRKTYESILAILGKPFPNRTNIVVTRDATYDAKHPGVIVTTSFEAALAAAKATHPTEIHIGGGAELYRQALPYTDRLHLTLVADPTVSGDTFFPEYAKDFVITATHEPITEHGVTYQWVDLARTDS